VFGCVFGGALFGMFLRRILPESHLSGDSKDTVKLGMGLVGTMTALVLGLLIASAKNFSDTQSSELTQMSANIVLLDRVLAHYGPETKEVRDLLHGAVARTLDRLWPKDGDQHPQMEPTTSGGEILVFWLFLILTSFGLFAPLNATAISTLFVCALCVSGAIFFILEMYSPYAGLLQISSAPLRSALAHLGQ
jgi:hypothetical protein